MAGLITGVESIIPATLKNILGFGDLLTEGHVNIYMFEGGTNFGFMNGANYYEDWNRMSLPMIMTRC